MLGRGPEPPALTYIYIYIYIYINVKPCICMHEHTLIQCLGGYQLENLYKLARPSGGANGPFGKLSRATVFMTALYPIL